MQQKYRALCMLFKCNMFPVPEMTYRKDTLGDKTTYDFPP